MFALALVCVLWGTTWIASKEGVRHIPDALQMAAIRQLLGGPALIHGCGTPFWHANCTQIVSYFHLLLIDFVGSYGYSCSVHDICSDYSCVSMSA